MQHPKLESAANATCAPQKNGKKIKMNSIYAVNHVGSSKWDRAIVKFYRHSDNVPVLQLMDKCGITDFEPATVNVREVTDDDLVHERTGQIKVMIHGVAVFPYDEEFSLIFTDMLKGERGVINQNLKFNHMFTYVFPCPPTLISAAK